MRIQHHETVHQRIVDPNSPNGSRTVHQYRRSDTSTISWVDPKRPGSGPQAFTRGDDGTFDVPDEVGRFFTSGTTGHGFRGWSVYTGPDVDLAQPSAAGTAEVAELKGQVAALTALVQQLVGPAQQAEPAPTATGA